MNSRLLGVVGVTCPLLLVIVFVLLRTNVITFTDDFTGFKGVGFMLGWIVVLVPVGVLTSGLALWQDRRSTLARVGASVNLVLAIVGTMMLLSLTF